MWWMWYKRILIVLVILCVVWYGLRFIVFCADAISRARNKGNWDNSSPSFADQLRQNTDAVQAQADAARTKREAALKADLPNALKSITKKVSDNVKKDAYEASKKGKRSCLYHGGISYNDWRGQEFLLFSSEIKEGIEKKLKAEGFSSIKIHFSAVCDIDSLGYSIEVSW